MDIALPQYGIATTDAERLTHSLKHTMSTYCMINRTEAGLSKALQQLESLKDEATALSKPHANDSEIAALARLQSQNQLATEMVKSPCASGPKAWVRTIDRIKLDTYLEQSTTNRYLWAP